MALTLEKGIRRTATGWRAYVRVYGLFRAKRFPSSTTLTEIREWRQDERYRLAHGEAALRQTKRTTFAHDAAAYLELVASMPTFKERAAHIQLWVEDFGPRRRATITGAEIAVVLERWRRQGLAEQTIKHRRTALMNLWTRLDGKSAANPVRDAPVQRRSDPAPRDQPYALLLAVLDRMPPSKARARLQVLLWTGTPPATMKRIRPRDLHLEAATFYRPGRHKGAGTRGETIPLLPPAVDAFREFVRLEAFGPFHSAQLWKAWKRACRRYVAAQPDRTERARLADVLAEVRPYDLRHSFGTLVLQTTQNLAATQKLLGHARPEQTLRYAAGAVDPLVAGAVARLRETLSGNFLATSDGLSGALGVRTAGADSSQSGAKSLMRLASSRSQ